MSSPFLDYLNVQTIFSLGTLMTPIIKPLIADLNLYIVGPIASKIRPTPTTTAAEKTIKVRAFLTSLIKYLIMIAVMAAIWKVIKFIIISATGSK